MLRTILLLLATLPLASQSPVTLSGTVTDATSGEQLTGVNVYLPATTTGVQTNTYGFYSITLPDSGRENQLVFSYLGYSSDTVVVASNIGSRRDVSLYRAEQQLSTVEVRAFNSASTSASAGVHQLDLRAVADNPVLLGEKDVLKTLQLLPGVSNPREGFGGLFVRGGTPGQNLILLDGAPVYNAFHLFGFLSVFNADALQGVTLYKGQYPARFGGRVSSVVDLRMKEGNRKEWHGAGGIGLLSSRLTLEGPIGRREKVSVLVSARRTYLDAIYNLLSGEKNKLYFYDGNFKVNYHLNDRQQLFISGYLGQDRFSFVDEYGGVAQTDGFDWGNRTLTVRYNRQLGERAFLNVTGIRTAFDFTVENEEVTRNRLYRVTYRSGIRDLTWQADLDYFLSNRHTLRTGISVTDHDFTLLTSAEVTNLAGERADGADTVRALEFTAYVEDEHTVSPQLTANYGLRFTRFAPRTGRAYAAAEPRLRLTYRLNNDWVATAGYAYTWQYLHQFSNSGPTLPTSLWVPASEEVRPQSGQLFSAGAAWSRPDRPWSVTGAIFYRRFNDIIRYTNGASFFLLDALNDPNQTNRIDVVENLTTGRARAGGFELGGSYTGTRLRASLAYTLSRVEEQLNGVNENDFYPAAQDRRHDLTLTARFDLRDNLMLSANWTFGSGVPTSIPITQYGISNNALPGFVNGINVQAEYRERNNYRMAPVHRLDMALRWRRCPRWGEVIWELGFYNAYSRANPFYISTARSRNGTRLVQHALFPIVPSFSFSFKF